MSDTEKKYDFEFRRYICYDGPRMVEHSTTHNQWNYDYCCYGYGEYHYCYSFKLLEHGGYVYYLETESEAMLQSFLWELTRERFNYIVNSLPVEKVEYSVDLLRLEDGKWKVYSGGPEIDNIETLNKHIPYILDIHYKGKYGIGNMPEDEKLEIKTHFYYGMPTHLPELQLTEAKEIPIIEDEEDDDFYDYDDDYQYSSDQCWKCGASKSGPFAVCHNCGED